MLESAGVKQAAPSGVVCKRKNKSIVGYVSIGSERLIALPLAAEIRSRGKVRLRIGAAMAFYLYCARLSTVLLTILPAS